MQMFSHCRIPVLAPLLAVCLIPVSAAPQNRRGNQSSAAKTEKRPVLEISRQLGLRKPVKIEVPRRAIAPGQLKPMAASTQVPVMLRYWGNTSMNGRVPGALGTPRLDERWSAELSNVVSVVAHRQSVLVQQAGEWTLLDDGGRKVQSGRSGRGGIALDSAGRLFFVLAPGNYMEARGLDNGEMQFQTPLGYNESYSWPLLFREHARLIAAGIQGQMLSPDRLPATTSVIEMIEMKSPLETDQFKQLMSVSHSETWLFDSPKLQAAWSPGRLICAYPNALAITDTALKSPVVYEGAFTPRSMSTDESGFVYLVVDTGKGTSLWVVSPEGSRVTDVPLRPEQTELAGPPMVDHLHRIYLLTMSKVFVFSQDGKVLWERAVEGSIAGGAITMDNRLLITAGKRLLLADAERLDVLHEFAEPLRTPPFVSAERKLVVAAGSKVHFFGL